MKVQRHGEAATLQVRLNGKDAEDAFFVIVKALREENKLRKRDGYAPILYEVETKEETAAEATAAVSPENSYA